MVIKWKGQCRYWKILDILLPSHSSTETQKKTVSWQQVLYLFQDVCYSAFLFLMHHVYEQFLLSGIKKSINHSSPWSNFTHKCFTPSKTHLLSTSGASTCAMLDKQPNLSGWMSTYHNYQLKDKGNWVHKSKFTHSIVIIILHTISAISIPKNKLVFPYPLKYNWEPPLSPNGKEMILGHRQEREVSQGVGISNLRTCQLGLLLCGTCWMKEH